MSYLVPFRVTPARPQEFSFAEIVAQGYGTESPVRSRGEAPVRSLWTKFSRSWSSLRHCSRILTAETIKIQNCGINWHPDSWPACFRVGAERHFTWRQHWLPRGIGSNYRFWHGVPQFNSLVRGESVNSGLRNLASKLETPLYRVLHNTFRYMEPCIRGWPMCLTDRQTDGQTERRTELR